MIDTKPRKVGAQVLAALDDVSAAVDSFATKLDRVLSEMNRISAQIVEVHDRLDGMTIELREYIKVHAQNIESTVEDVKDTVRDLETTVSAISKEMPYLQEITDDIHRKERQEWLLDARAAMGKVAFVRVK